MLTRIPWIVVETHSTDHGQTLRSWNDGRSQGRSDAHQGFQALGAGVAEGRVCGLQGGVGSMGEPPSPLSRASEDFAFEDFLCDFCGAQGILA